MSMKNPLTPAGIEPENFRFVAQRLNHCAIAGFGLYVILYITLIARTLSKPDDGRYRPKHVVFYCQ